jgi:hypothetical protein
MELIPVRAVDTVSTDLLAGTVIPLSIHVGHSDSET